MSVLIGKCPRCKTPVRTTTEEDERAASRGARCGKCNAWTVLFGVKGVLSDHPCDARCSGARGHDCECQCVGRNHGADYALVLL